MLIAFDIGNSGISVGIFSVSENTPMLRLKARLASDVRRTSDEYIIQIRGILLLHQVNPAEISASAISSVVPELTATIAAAAQFFSGRPPLVLGPGVRTGLNIRIDQQTQLGSDIVANAVAALVRTTAPAVIADFGTATTLAVIDMDASLTGAIICPGVRVSMDALAHSASLLGGVDLERPASIVGKNTHDSVTSGVIYGHILMIDGFIRELRHSLCTNPNVKLSLIATGGLADRIVPYCRNRFTCVEALTLHGIAEIYMRNRSAV